MKQLIFISATVFLLISCNSNTSNSNSAKTIESSQEKQLNVSILLDLSDRIDPQKNPATPEHYQRDIENVKILTEFFKSNMKDLGAYKSKGKIKIFFNPPPENPEINSIADKLNIDCSKIDNKERKEVYDNITELFTKNLEDIYKQTIETSNWAGSNIWSFFKDDVKDFCVESDTNYRNILVILTDGYLFHQQSKYQDGNRFSYLLDANIKQYRKQNWKQLIEQKNFGIIAERNDLNNLEVIVLEVSATNPNNKIDEDVLIFLLKKWFDEMNISRYEVYRSDLPANTKKRIENFLLK